MHDAETISICLFLAMEEIVYKFIGEKDAAKAISFLLHFATKTGNQYSFENCWVAEMNESVVACANVYDGADLEVLRKPVLEFIHNSYNKDFHPDDETSAGEYYIDCIGVMPDHQGKGYGSKLLQFLIDEYVQQQHQTLGLLVDLDNPNAKRLYLKLGFNVVGAKTIFGKTMHHLQVNPF